MPRVASGNAVALREKALAIGGKTSKLAAVLSKLNFGKKSRKSQKAITRSLSDLISVCNQKLKVKTLTRATRSPFALSASWTELKVKRCLQNYRSKLKLCRFVRRHLLRAFPSSFRIDSSNFGPQKVKQRAVRFAPPPS